VWIEAEDYAATNFTHFETSSMGKEALLSGGKWIMRGVKPDEVESLVPDEGVRLSYNFGIEEAGQYRLWVRVGWFRARADCKIRLNGGDWIDLPSNFPTRNLMEMGFFAEASWANLGLVELRQGDGKLNVWYPKISEGNKRMLMALDCFALIKGAFTPEGPFKPGQGYSSERDREAAGHVFKMNAAKQAERVEAKLNGLWEVARYDDPNMDVDTYEPVRSLPKPSEYALRWMAFEVPGDPWRVEPLVFGHRLIYRTRVDVPRSHRGRGFKLHFSGTNWIVSVFVNGRLAGTHKGVWVPWDLDVSQFIKAGRINEIAVAVKGTYYAFDPKGLGDNTLMNMRNRPLSRKDWTRWVAPMYPSTKGDGDGYIYGIVNPVRLISVGRTYTEDVFIKPSVAKKRLQTEVTVRNTTGSERSLEVTCEAVREATDAVEKRFSPVKVDVAAKAIETVVVEGAWTNPKLWWPEPNAQLYRLRTTIRERDNVVDVHEEVFGFREVTVEGTGVRINGVRRNLWNWVDVHANLIERPEDWAKAFHEDGSRFMRFSHGRRITQVLKSREQRLAFYDRAGIPGRLCTMIDGMFITFKLGDSCRGPDGKQTFHRNEPVWENFREHMAQVAKAYRNHPSVIMYQVENELVYINGMNIYGSHLDQIEQWMNEVVEAGRRQDPTRPYTVGGGGDLSGRLEINSPHYPHTAFDYYPDNAYSVDRYATKIERWPWNREKPWIVGESCFANELAFGAYVAGDEVFRGIDYARKGKAKWLRMLYGGYRWAGVAGFFPWDNLWNYEDAQKIFSDLYAVPRRQTARLYAGRSNDLVFKIMNDTLKEEAVTVEWSYMVEGKTCAAGRDRLPIKAGHGRQYTISISAPKTKKRLEGTLRIALSAGDERYCDERLVPVLPAVETIQAASKIAVLDSQRKVTPWLERAGLSVEVIESLEALNERSGLLIVGPDALTPAQATGTGLLAFAAAGGRVICLEQETPPSGAALPVPIRTTTRFGGYAHPQALGTPVFSDLGKDDLIDWAGDHPTYKQAYRKPLQAARSLAECGGDLEYSPLIEVPCDKGVIVLCQLRVGANLGLDPAADVLLRNMIDVYNDYEPAQGKAAVFAPAAPLLVEKVEATGMLLEKVDTLAEALHRQASLSADADRVDVLIVDGSEATLSALLQMQDKTKAYQSAGGWLMVCGVTPASIDEFNRLTGQERMLRPFRIERVTLEAPHYRLAATLGNRDVALQSPEELMHGRYWVSGNTFSYVIDQRDFAPFARPPGGPADPFAYKPTKDDHDPYNFTNGMLSSDSWRYIRQIWVGENGSEPLVFELRRPDVLSTIRIWNNEFYWTIKDLDVIIDGDRDTAIAVEMPDASDMVEVTLPQPRKVNKTITLQIRSWRQRRIKREDLRLVGIDNVQFLRPQAPKGAVFLDNVGGLVAFPKGAGGVFLNQLKFMAEEPREANAGKKLRILGVLLQNVGIGSASASAVAVPGLNVRFAPVNIQEYCNAYLSAKAGKAAWFGAKEGDLRLLPRGKHVMAGVEYHVVDYLTAPIPDCIILGGKRARCTVRRPLRENPGPVRRLAPEVKSIPVGREADVLYFLHTAHVGGPVAERERERMIDHKRPFVLPTVFKYVLHYADGKSAEIPVVLERHVDHWLKDEAMPLESARIAWSKELPGVATAKPGYALTKPGGQGKRAVLYSMQAANPRPDVKIASMDVVRTSDRAVPAVVAVSLGQIVE
jgi:beta-galactosidase